MTGFSEEPPADERASAPEAAPARAGDRLDDEAVKTLLKKIARPHRSGGHVVERAAIFASGVDALEVLEWIDKHDGVPEAPSASGAGRGLHGSRVDGPASTKSHTRRFILPAGALSARS